MNDNYMNDVIALPAARPDLARPSDTPLNGHAHLNGHGPLNGHAHLNGELAQRVWQDTRALSWILNPATGDLRLRDVQAGTNVEQAPFVNVEILAAALLQNVKEDRSEPLRMLKVLPAPDGTLHHFLVIGFPIGGVNGAPAPQLAGVAIDVTRHKVRVDTLAQQALEDELTGLYNLRGFHLFAEHELRVARRRGTTSAVVCIDIDGLKTVNDTLGHGQGNALIRVTAELLRQAFRECDVIARLGGDEFAVFATDMRGDPEQLRKRIDGLMTDTEHAKGLSLSVGVASAPDNNTPLADLLAVADKNMYRNKFDKNRGDTRYLRAGVAAGLAAK